MNISPPSPGLLQNIDINSPHFHNNVQDVIDIELAKLKKNVTIVQNLRIIAAEMEVDVAALYHAELLSEVENLKLADAESKAENEQ